MIFYISCELWHDDRALPSPRTPQWDETRLEEELGVYVDVVRFTNLAVRTFLRRYSPFFLLGISVELYE